MEVAVDNVQVRCWSGSRARSVLAYLATHRAPWPSCEVLMEVFWPSSPAAAARNSLHVAIHGLRRAMRAVTDRPVIVRDGDTYRVHRSVQVSLDIEEFERRLALGRRHQHGGRHEAAIAEYEGAAALYRGDLLAENPYDDWSALPRERMRLALLDLLLRLSTLYFAEGRYITCTDLCRRILEQDPCNEETRRLLMRCHTRQGHPHLALIEFRACAEVLATQLRVAPDPATTALRDRIRRHEPV
jgi:DNA-binding SARP family transcriptional activator